MESKNIGLAKIHKFCGNVSWVFFSHMDQNSGDIIKRGPGFNSWK